LAEAEDQVIWAYAKAGGFTLVSHDADFAELAALHGHPPKVVWLRIGNQPTSFVAETLRRRAQALIEFHDDPSAACLEIY
jgi:predicted nuclease of predicted toxin-antitoxin system